MKNYLLCKTNVLRWLAMCALLLFAMQHATVNGQPAESSDSLEYISVSFGNTRYLFCKSESRLAYQVQHGETDSVPQLTFYSGLCQRLASDIYEGLERLDKQISDPNFNYFIDNILEMCDDAANEIPLFAEENNAMLNDASSFNDQMMLRLEKLQENYDLLVQIIGGSSTEKNHSNPVDYPCNIQKVSKTISESFDSYYNWKNYKGWGLGYCRQSLEEFKEDANILVLISKANPFSLQFKKDIEAYMQTVTEKISACEKEYSRLDRSIRAIIENNGFLSESDKIKFSDNISRNLSIINGCSVMIADNNFKEYVYDYNETVDDVLNALRIMRDFYSVYPVNILIYQDWLKEVLDLLASIPSDFRNWIIDHGNKLELPSHIWCDGTRYPVTRTEFISLYGWENPMELILPETLKEININCFWDCPNITKVVCLNPEPPVLPERGFVQKTYDTALLVVPDGCMDAYLTEGKDLNWYRFKRITEASAAESGITDVEGDPISVFDGEIHLNGTYATIHDLSGRLVYSGNGNKISLPKGCLYILKTKHETMKIIL